MNATMPGPAPSGGNPGKEDIRPVDLPPETAATLDEVQHSWQECRADPHFGNKGVGVPTADALLAQFSLHLRARLPAAGGAFDGPDVILATQIYKDGGHTGLIGDLARALEESARRAGAALPRLVITDLLGHNAKPPSPRHRARLGPVADSLVVLGGASREERLAELAARMLAWRPRRVFLCHHPEDPLPVVVSGPGWTGQCLLVHHADAVPCLGLHAPETRVIDLNPTAAAVSRVLGLDPALLPLTVPDPGPRPGCFLARGDLVTATCARSHKVRSEGPVAYTTIVPLVLAATGGWHIHIGALDDDLLAAIHGGLRAAGIEQARFVHVPLVSSLSHALHEHAVDVYLSSFPIDGARANVEVAAAGVPHLRYRREGGTGPPGGFPVAGSVVWSTWGQLREILATLHDRAVLEEKSKLSRGTYDRQHHPRVFAATLDDILAGGEGWVDPEAGARDVKARSWLAVEEESG